MPRVGSLALHRYRSYVAVESSTCDFGQTTFLVGRNASGKTSFLDALAFISEVATEPLGTVLDRRGGIEAVRSRIAGRGFPPDLYLGAELDLPSFRKAHYLLVVKAAKSHGIRVKRESCLFEVPDGSVTPQRFERTDGLIHSTVKLLDTAFPANDSLLLPLIGGIKPFDEVVKAFKGILVYAIDPVRMRSPQIPDDGRILARDGSNVASVVRRMRKTTNWNYVIEFLRSAIPQVVDVDVKRSGPWQTLLFRQKWGVGKEIVFDGHQVSDGTLRVLGILLALFQLPHPTLVGIEEPELGLHPGALAVILDAIRTAGEMTQVVVTTQSSDLLDDKDIQPEDIRIVEWTESGSKVSRLSAGTTEVLRQHLATPGDLMRSRALEESAAA